VFVCIRVSLKHSKPAQVGVKVFQSNNHAHKRTHKCTNTFTEQGAQLVIDKSETRPMQHTQVRQNDGRVCTSRAKRVAWSFSVKELM